MVFNVGDKVRHADRPEWGAGVVDQAVAIQHEGRPAQQLTVKFEHKGRTTLNTAYAKIVPADHASVAAHTQLGGPTRFVASSGSNSAGSTTTARPTDVLVNLPDAATDPLASLGRRLKITLMLFRFSTEPRSLIDWAVSQTGLYDPLTEFSRHDLETAFRFFAHKREQHLKELVRQIRRANQQSLFQQLDPQTPPAARDALAKAIKSA
jgi:hypothetical protein